MRNLVVEELMTLSLILASSLLVVSAVLFMALYGMSPVFAGAICAINVSLLIIFIRDEIRIQRIKKERDGCTLL